MSLELRPMCCLIVLAIGVLLPLQKARGAHLYDLAKSVPLGAPEHWDYLSYEPAAHRLYVIHGSRIDVLDAHSGAVLGKVSVPGANGVAFSASGRGYAGSRAHKTVVVFDLKSLRILTEIPADEDTDGVLYDPKSRRIFVMEGDPHRVLVIDTSTDTVVGRIELGGAPEFAAVDDQGKVFVNLKDQRSIARIDTSSLHIEARWPIASCESPHGLALDLEAHRLFASCINSRMVAVDADNGHVLAELPIGKGSDAAAFDPKRTLAFSSNGEGTLSVIRQGSGTAYELVDTVTTVPSARTMTLDPDSGRIYLSCGERIEVAASARNAGKRYGIKPGSMRVLFLDPVE